MGALRCGGQARCRVARFPRVALGSVISGSAKIPHQCAHWIRDDKDAATSCHFESSAHAGEKSLRLPPQPPMAAAPPRGAPGRRGRRPLQRGSGFCIVTSLRCGGGSGCGRGIPSRAQEPRPYKHDPARSLPAGADALGGPVIQRRPMGESPCICIEKDACRSRRLF